MGVELTTRSYSTDNMYLATEGSAFRHQKFDPYGVVINGGIGAAGSPMAHPRL